MRISVAFPPTPQTPAHIQLAEELGYQTAWVYDTPALQLDVWMTLALAAERTDRIRLGPGVLIPSLRHPMVTASAIATLVDLVGEDRVIIGAGTGFTGRRAMGQKPLKWADFPEMIHQIQALLRGETIRYDGELISMLHWDGQAPQRPIEVPWIFGVNGPRGLNTAAEMGCGVFTSRPRPDASYERLDDVILLTSGAVMSGDETVDSPRVIETAGPWVSVAYHAFLEQNDQRLGTLPNADEFRRLVEQVPEDGRHLRVHEGHLTHLNDIDREVVVGESMFLSPFTLYENEVVNQITELEAHGITEIAYQPMGDIEREMRTFASAAGIA